MSGALIIASRSRSRASTFALSWCRPSVCELQTLLWAEPLRCSCRPQNGRPLPAPLDLLEDVYSSPSVRSRVSRGPRSSQSRTSSPRSSISAYVARITGRTSRCQSNTVPCSHAQRRRPGQVPRLDPLRREQPIPCGDRSHRAEVAGASGSVGGTDGRDGRASECARRGALLSWMVPGHPVAQRGPGSSPRRSRSGTSRAPLMTRSQWFTDPAVGAAGCTESGPAIARGGVGRDPQALHRGTSG